MSPLQATMSLVRSDGRRSPGCLNLVLLRDLFIYFSTKRSPVSTQRQCGVMVEVHFQPKKSEKLRESLKTKKNISLLIHILGAPALFWKVVRLLDE